MSTSEPWRNPPPPPQLDEIRSRMPNQSMIPNWLRVWWPALLWAALISIASTDTFSAEHTGSILRQILHWLLPNISEARFELVHHIIRKCAHFTEYFIFYVLLFRAMRGLHQGFKWSWAIEAWVIAAVYSCLDEIHQSFVASRTASPWDSLLDSTGAFVAMIIVFLFLRYRSSRKTQTA